MKTKVKIEQDNNWEAESNEQKFRELIFDNILESVIITAPDGKIMDANPATQTMFGYSIEEIIGHSPADLWHSPEDSDLNPYIVETVRSGESWSGEIRYCRKNGIPGVCQVVVIPLFENGEYIASVGVSHDITDNKRIQQELLDQKLVMEDLVAVARATSEGVSLEDTLRGALNVVVNLTDAERGSLFLFDEEEMVTNCILAETDFTKQKNQTSIVNKVVATGLAGWVAENKQLVVIEDAEKDDRWLSLPDQPYQTSSVLALPIMVKDHLVGILMLKHSDKDHFTPENVKFIEMASYQIGMALRNAQVFEQRHALARRQTILYEVIKVLGKNLDLESLLDTAVQTIAQMTGWPEIMILIGDEKKQDLTIQAGVGKARTMIGKKVSSDKGLIKKTLRQKQGQMAYGLGIELPHVITGDDTIYSEMVVPLHIGSETFGFLNIMNNQMRPFSSEDLFLAESLTDTIALALENANLVSELYEARDDAESATRAKSAFLANMSHELRTPLNSIISYSEYLVEDLDELEQPDMAEDVQNILDESKRLLGMINHILDLSKIEYGRMDTYFESVDIVSFVEELNPILNPLLAKNQNSYEVKLEDSLGSMVIDVAKLRQVMVNLLGNAAKFTKEGMITLYVTKHNQDGEEWLWLTVADNGMGISPENLENLFEVFSQGDVSVSRKYGGTGLGLAISQRYCEMMGGRIDVESELDKGSSFTVKIPLSISQSEQSEMFVNEPKKKL